MSYAHYIRRTALLLLASPFLTFSAPDVTFGESRPAADAGIFSACPGGTEIQAVVQELSDRTGLWFSLDPSLPYRRISVRCGRMTIGELFETIFPRENISFVYDTDNDLVGAVVAAEGSPAVQGMDTGVLFFPMTPSVQPPLPPPNSQDTP